MMRLRVLLPFKVFLDATDVSRIVAETTAGFFGVLPHRLDCIATLVPGIFAYDRPDGGQRFLAVDEGVLVKTGADVTVAIRNAIAGDTLEELHEIVERTFVALDEREKEVRSVFAKLESNFLRRLAEVRHE